MGAAAVDPLIEALQDKEGAVRKFAVILLGNLKDPRAMEPLAMAQYDLYHEVGKIAAVALAGFGVPAVPLLSGALQHPEMWIRIHAVRALGGIKDPESTTLLLEMLNDPEREVKKQAIESLGGRKDPAVLTTLEIIAANRADRELGAIAKNVLEKNS
jgi:HEAT repeat protein